MANLKRNAIELVTGVENDEVKTKVYYTPRFIPLSVTYEAIELTEMFQPQKDENGEPIKPDEIKQINQLADFIATSIYDNQFTTEDVINGLHAPEAMEELMGQVMFVANGEQSGKNRKLVQEIN